MKSNKFRVWCTVTKSYGGGNLWHLASDGTLYYGNAEWPEGLVEWCVGITDNEGKDIYEGDIICFADGYTDYAGDGVETISIGEVKFDEEQACFYTTNRIGIDAGEVWEYLDELKVIGNIHQNLELLTT